MTSVTNLAREIATELQDISGAKINTSDYLKIRKLAAKEIATGLYDADANVVAPNIDSSELSNIPVLEIKSGTVVGSKPFKEIKKQEITTKAQPLEPIPDESDDFFSLCNKM